LTCWTADSKSVIFTSNRNDTWAIFRQALGSDTAVPIVSNLVRWLSRVPIISNSSLPLSILLRAGRDELMRIGRDPQGQYLWDISPTATSIAIVKRSDAQVRILSLNGKALQEVAPKGWNVADSLDWTIDGRALLISSRVEGQLSLLRVDLQGSAPVLSRPGGEERQSAFLLLMVANWQY
jgi:Tol biopolymer transport system component